MYSRDANVTLHRWKKEYVLIPTILDGGVDVNYAYLVLSRVGGKDASKQFWKYHNEGILKKYKGKLQVGSLNTKAAAAPVPEPAAATKEAPKPKQAAPVDVSAQSSEPQDPYGDLIPFADPSWYQGVSLPGTHNSGNYRLTNDFSTVLLSILQPDSRSSPR